MSSVSTAFYLIWIKLNSRDKACDYVDDSENKIKNYENFITMPGCLQFLLHDVISCEK